MDFWFSKITILLFFSKIRVCELIFSQTIQFMGLKKKISFWNLINIKSNNFCFFIKIPEFLKTIFIKCLTAELYPLPILPMAHSARKFWQQVSVRIFSVLYYKLNDAFGLMNDLVQKLLLIAHFWTQTADTITLPIN